MDRDMDAIRQIVMAVKDSDAAVTQVAGIPNDVFKFNAMLLIEAGLAKGVYEKNTRSHSPVPSMVLIDRLTWDGFEFANSIKDGTIWEKAKKHILKPAGSWSFEILMEYIKEQAKLKLGMDGGS